MNRIWKQAVCFFLSGVLFVGCAFGAFAEIGTTAPGEELTTSTVSPDPDRDGALTAADARLLARAVSGKDADEHLVRLGDYNSDGKVSLADAGVLLRAAAGIEPLESLNSGDSLAMKGLGLYDPVVSANGKSFSVAEYNYYYASLYMSYAQQAYYYDQYYGYGYGAALTGFDYTLSPAQQYMTASDGTQISYAEYFDDLAVATMEQYSYYIAQAEELGLTLDEEAQAYVDENMQALSERAAEYGVTPDAFLEQQYGSGINSYVFFTVMKDQLLAQAYQEHIGDEISAGITDGQIEKVYNSDPAEYQCATIRAFRIAAETKEDGTQDTEKQQADAAAFMAKVTDEASFVQEAAQADPVNFSDNSDSLLPDVDSATLAQYIGEDAAEWTFDSARKAGDKQVFTAGSYVFVLFVVSPAARNEVQLPSVRHILVLYDDSEENQNTEQGVTNAAGEKVPTKQEAYALCEKYLKEYKRGDKTEESFAALAEKYSADTASLSSGGQGKEGGLYSDIRRGYYVEPFENWAYDEARQPGDVEIIETEHGYHIMYFVGKTEEPQWKRTIRAELAEEQTDDFMDSLGDRYAGSARFNEECEQAAYAFALECVENYL